MDATPNRSNGGVDLLEIAGLLRDGAIGAGESTLFDENWPDNQ
jgi:hypothetical protein